jgi:hypothetical protein
MTATLAIHERPVIGLVQPIARKSDKSATGLYVARHGRADRLEMYITNGLAKLGSQEDAGEPKNARFWPACHFLRKAWKCRWLDANQQRRIRTRQRSAVAARN